MVGTVGSKCKSGITFLPRAVRDNENLFYEWHVTVSNGG
jgi:hypothetical protein